MIWLILGIVVFLGIHSVRMVAPEFRQSMIEKLSLGGWKGIYTLITFSGLILMVWGFSQARLDPIYVYEPPSFLRHLAHGLIWVAFVSLAAAELPVGRIKATLKHPMITGIKIWAFSHLLVNGDLASVLLFGSLLAWSIWNRIAVKRRGGEVLVAGPIGNDIIAVAAGTAIYAVIAFWAHGWLIGVPLF